MTKKINCVVVSHKAFAFRIRYFIFLNIYFITIS